MVKPYRPKVVAARVRNHVELKRLRDQIRRQALRDGLTGLANRRCFDEGLLEAWSHCVRDRKPLALILLDIDYFKRYNDALGHLAGDDCLRQVAAALSRCITTPGALVARYGGEEFVCLLPEADAIRAMAQAEYLRGELQAMRIPHPGSDVEECVTVSLGVASVRPAEGRAPEELLQKADQRLYQAKAEGRNRVCG